jgi:rubrerythrin
MAETLIGAAPWEQELYDHLATHQEKERGLLERYQQAAAESGSAAFRYLVTLILEDEVRHHRLFADLSESLRTDTELRPQEARIPRLDYWGDHRQLILELTDGLLAQERSDAKDLRRLGKQLDDVKDTTLWHLLVELMEADTAKHIRILQFIKRNARRKHPW